MDDGVETSIKKKYNEVFESLIQKYSGTALQNFGGSTLSYFHSAIDAVHCAIDMQQTFCKDPEIPVRIGIHSGDIILSQKEAIGDGVNVASRIESLAVGGSIFISEKVYDEIKNQKSIKSQVIGTYKLKNIEQPIKVYAISNPGLVVPSSDTVGGNRIDNGQIRPAYLKRRFGRLPIFIVGLIVAALIFFLYAIKPWKEARSLEKSIAILPLVNLSDDPEQEYFSDGITEDIITQLSKIGEVRVISRTSSMIYKNTTKSAREIGRELGVAHILEGSVRKYDDNVRISVQVIDAETDGHIWSENFDRKLTDILNLQKEVSLRIANGLKAKLTEVEEYNFNKKLTNNPEAYEFYLQGHHQLRSGNMDGIRKSYPLLRQAVTIDPDFAQAYAEIAEYYIFMGNWLGNLSRKAARDQALPYIQKALKLNPDLEFALNSLATVMFWFDWDFEGAEQEYLKCKCPEEYGFFLMLMSRFDEAEEQFAVSYAINPFDTHDRPHRGVNRFFKNRPDEAIQILLDGIRMHPNAVTGYHKLGKIYLNVGKYREAIDILLQGLEIGEARIPAILGELAVAYYKTGQKDETTKIIEELKLSYSADLKGSPAFFVAQSYAGIGEPELAFQWLEKSYKAHEVEMIWLKIEPQFQALRDDPRFGEMLEKVGF